MLRGAIGSRLDLVRAVGARHALRRVRADRVYRRTVEARRSRLAADMWCRAADALGAEVRKLDPGLLEIRLGGRTTRVSGQTTAFADPVSGAIASDKLLAYRLLAEAGVAVPDHMAVAPADRRKALAFLHAAAPPCVVKPLQARGGAGVTGEVRTPAQLVRALGRAGRISRQAIVERQVAGEHYRVLVLDGAPVDVLCRGRPRVVGDGRSTIESLMFREYERRLAGDGPAGLKELVADLDCLFTLEHAGLGLGSVRPRDSRCR